MSTDHRSVELEILARLQTQISDSLGRLYDASRSRDYVICDELGQAMQGSDKLIFVYRAIAKMCEAGTPKHFSEQEAALIDALERSTQKTVDDTIGYLLPGPDESQL